MQRQCKMLNCVPKFEQQHVSKAEWGLRNGSLYRKFNCAWQRGGCLMAYALGRTAIQISTNLNSELKRRNSSSLNNTFHSAWPQEWSINRVTQIALCSTQRAFVYYNCSWCQAEHADGIGGLANACQDCDGEAPVPQHGITEAPQHLKNNSPDYSKEPIIE